MRYELWDFDGNRVVVYYYFFYPGYGFESEIDSAEIYIVIN